MGETFTKELENGPLPAIWIRIAYVAVQKLLAERFPGRQLPDDAATKISVHLRPLARCYVIAAVDNIALGGVRGSDEEEAFFMINRHLLMADMEVDEQTDKLLTETMREQFPIVFSRPLTVLFLGENLEVRYADGRYYAVSQQQEG